MEPTLKDGIEACHSYARHGDVHAQSAIIWACWTNQQMVKEMVKDMTEAAVADGPAAALEKMKEHLIVRDKAIFGIMHDSAAYVEFQFERLADGLGDLSD